MVLNLYAPHLAAREKKLLVPVRKEVINLCELTKVHENFILIL
jgi:hypothetical protein